MRRQHGIALIQVLLVTGIIGLLMLQMALTAREQVARAQLLSDRAALQLAAQSRESALLYTMLTEPLAIAPKSPNPYAAAWNFQDQPFDVDGATFRIQDESGLLRVSLYGAQDFEALLVKLGVEPNRARALGIELLALQGSGIGRRDLGDTGGRSPVVGGLYPLQDIGELRLLPGMDSDLYRRLLPLLTLYPTPGFNPVTAPPALLSAALTGSQVTAVEEARQKRALDSITMWKLTGVEADDRTVLTPGPAFTVRLELTQGSARIARSTTFIVRPYQTEALGVWQRSTGDGQDEG